MAAGHNTHRTDKVVLAGQCAEGDDGVQSGQGVVQGKEVKLGVQNGLLDLQQNSLLRVQDGVLDVSNVVVHFYTPSQYSIVQQSVRLRSRVNHTHFRSTIRMAASHLASGCSCRNNCPPAERQMSTRCCPERQSSE